MKQKIAEIINIIFGFRKFLLMLMLYLIGIVFRIKGFVNGAEMVDLFKTTTLAFMGANGVEHIVTCVKEYNAGNVAAVLGNQDQGDIVPPSDQEANDAKEGAT